ncbi:unnamed protein product [Effrenium voratum]|nr:unnamed protein product [Effrenium voratum]
MACKADGALGMEEQKDIQGKQKRRPADICIESGKKGYTSPGQTSPSSATSAAWSSKSPESSKIRSGSPSSEASSREKLSHPDSRETSEPHTPKSSHSDPESGSHHSEDKKDWSDSRETSEPLTPKSSHSDPESRAEVTLSRDQAVALQQQLLLHFTSPAFVMKLNGLARKYLASKGTDKAARAAFKQLVRSYQFQVIPNYGFECSDQGVEDMLKAFKEHEEDSDVYVNTAALKEALFSASQYPQLPEEDEFAVIPEPEEKPTSKIGVLDLMQNMLVAFSDPAFQEEVYLLRKEADQRAGRRLVNGYQPSTRLKDPDGYYHLPGRQELALQVQCEILPNFGFEGTRKGVREMICHIGPYLSDPDVASTFDAINMKLGMTAAAATRFRKLAIELGDSKSLPMTGISTRQRFEARPVEAH